MTVELNHTIVPVHDKEEGAAFLTAILGLEPPQHVGPFVCVRTSNGVCLDYDDRWEVVSHHYCFLVSDDAFDAAFARIVAADLAYNGAPNGSLPGEIYHSKTGGRGVYFSDPDGHLMELLTVDVFGRTAATTRDMSQ
ncbi:VOC family protein [Actinocatenispora sera]|uniref:VOC family protein n=1 Tax=Actinocatenispora sera TaxID=390989 RepID=UPI0033C13CC3